MNIEELARQAGMDIDRLDGGYSAKSIGLHTVLSCDLERFAALVLEQAAQKCDDGSIEGKIFAEAIRAMKPNTTISGGTPAA